jgi:hypothetical protein
MKKQYWTIIQPDGNVWMNSWWKWRYGLNGAWNFLFWSLDKSVKKLKEEGYRVVKCWVEVDEK